MLSTLSPWISIPLLVSSLLFSAEGDLDVSEFISPSRKYIEFHLKNRSDQDLLCEFIKVQVKYTAGTTGVVIGRRDVSIENVIIKAKTLSFKQEAGKDHIAALEQSYPDAQIADILGDVKYKCGPLPAVSVLPGKDLRLITALTLSEDEKWIAAGTSDGKIGVWDLHQRALSFVLDDSSPLTGYEIYPKNQIHQLIFLAGKNQVIAIKVESVSAWDLTTKQKTWSMAFAGQTLDERRFPPRVTQLSNGSFFASFVVPERTEIFTVGQSTSKVLSISSQYVGFQIFKMNTRFIGRTPEDTAEILDFPDGTQRNTLQAPNGSLIGVSADGQVATLVLNREKISGLLQLSVEDGSVLINAPAEIPADIEETFSPRLLRSGSVAFDYQKGTKRGIGLLSPSGKVTALSEPYGVDHRSGNANDPGNLLYAEEAWSVGNDEQTAYVGMMDGSIKAIRLIR